MSVTVTGVDGPGDILQGGSGNDRLLVTSGTVPVDGKGGTDLLTIDTGASATFANGTISGIERISVRDGGTLDLGAFTGPVADLQTLDLAGTNLTTIHGTKGADHITGGFGAHIALYGNAGDDVIVIRATPDMVDGGAGNGDKLIVAAGTDIVLTNANFSGIEKILVQDGASLDMSGVSGGRQIQAAGTASAGITVIGTAGNDVISGGDANDVITGGAGRDQVKGGLGADHFVFGALGDFASGGRVDTILDFSHAQGDKIDLSAIDADPVAPGQQHFSFIGQAAFTLGGDPNASELRVLDDHNGSFRVFGDTNHDGHADFTLLVTTTTNLVVGDFIL